MPMRIAIVLSACCVWVAAAAADEKPAYAVKANSLGQKSFVEKLKGKVPPLKHARGHRWPMIVWEGVGFEPQSPEALRVLLERGLVQHVQLDEKMIPAAQAIQQAGGPVILMQGGGGPWPAQLAGPPGKWQHQFQEGYTFKQGKDWDHDHIQPCLTSFEGWQIEADKVRGILRAYKTAGVTVNAVWMDWEGDPRGPQFEQASHCVRCRQTLPPWVLANEKNCRNYTSRLYQNLMDTYLAAPVAEVFPGCSTTNWMVVCSTPERPVVYWNDRAVPPTVPGLFTATNPVAYGNTVFWGCWQKDWPLDREHVDQFYTHLLLRMVSADAANLRQYAPEKKSVPWISRWCPDVEDDRIPILSRARYREVLRHIWLRGAAGMQIFNPSRPGYEDVVMAEAEDAVAVYDEMLAYARFLDDGESMCLADPQRQDNGVLWSGLRLKDEAVVRVIKQGGGQQPLTFEAWPGKQVTLEAPAAGRTYLLKLAADKVTATAQPQE